MPTRPIVFLEPSSSKADKAELSSLTAQTKLIPEGGNAGERKGVLIAFEGVDGTGKSTQARLLAEALRDAGQAVVLTREPTDGPYGRKIRELFTARETVSRAEELELFLADRRQHVDQVIAPALAQGRIVVTDRYYLSTVAYQGAAGLDPCEILSKNQDFAPVPDLVILLVLPVTQGLERIRLLRGETPNAFEQEAGLARVARIFECMSGEFIRRVDADRPPAEIHRDILAQVMPMVRKMP